MKCGAQAGDRDIRGNVNELAAIADEELPEIWKGIMDRLLAIPEYRQRFGQAFPEVPVENLGFQHAANAIAAFEEAAFSPRDGAWDRYLDGDNDAISEAAKRGASHFYGGSCASCHSGSLMTDQEHHNRESLSSDRGKTRKLGLDPGRELETGESADEFAFRTPQLRNVVLTGPWTHNGAFTNLEEVIRHKFDPASSLANYDVSQLPELLQPTVRLDAASIAALTQSLDPLLPIGEQLSAAEASDLMAFLFSLTSPSADRMLQQTPASVPSGLEVDRLPPSEIGVVYDLRDGQLRLVGTEDMPLDALFLRISADETGGPANFEFQTVAAPGPTIRKSS